MSEIRPFIHIDWIEAFATWVGRKGPVSLVSHKLVWENREKMLADLKKTGLPVVFSPTALQAMATSPNLD